MNDISTESSEYQSLETLLMQKHPSNRFQQFKERETKEMLDWQATQPTSQIQPTVPDKVVHVPEKTRTSSSLKSTSTPVTSE